MKKKKKFPQKWRKRETSKKSPKDSRHPYRWHEDRCKGVYSFNDALGRLVNRRQWRRYSFSRPADQFHGTRQGASCRRTNIQRHLAPTRDDSSLVDQTSLADRLVGWLFQWKKLLPKCHEANSLFLSGKSLGLRRTTLVTFSDGWPSRSSSAGC